MPSDRIFPKLSLILVLFYAPNIFSDACRIVKTCTPKWLQRQRRKVHFNGIIFLRASLFVTCLCDLTLVFGFNFAHYMRHKIRLSILSNRFPRARAGIHRHINGRGKARQEAARIVKATHRVSWAAARVLSTTRKENMIFFFVAVTFQIFN